MKVIALLFCLGCVPSIGRATELNLATLTCAKYQNEVMAPTAANTGVDSINTMMWLFGFSVGKSGAHTMFGDALAGFGFAVDAECKNNPSESLLNALTVVKPDNKNPMDLQGLQCATFAARHLDLLKSDRESADTIMMWLFGFAVAKSGSHVFDASGLSVFDAALMADCKKYPDRNLFDALVTVKFPKSL
jgi:hypothetical protein